MRILSNKISRSSRCESALIFPGKIVSRLTSAATIMKRAVCSLPAFGTRADAFLLSGVPKTDLLLQ